MIQLFHINNHIIDTSEFSNLLHDDIVSKFENKFAQYVERSMLAQLIVPLMLYSYLC